MSTVLVTGAAGELGRRVVERLAATTWAEQVIGVDRSPMVTAWPKLEVHTFDLCSTGAADELAALGKRATAIVHLAWGPTGSNLEMLRSAMDAAEAVQPNQFVFLSSATVYGAWADNPVPLTEDVAPRPNPEFSFAVEKRAAEIALERWAADKVGLVLTTLRPACTVGPFEQPLCRALMAPARYSNAERMVQYIHIDDLAGAVVHVLTHSSAGIFNVAPDTGMTDDMARALAGGPAGLPLPGRLRGLVSEARGARDRLVGRSWPRGSKAYASHTWVVAGDRLRRSGWDAEYSSEEALVVTDPRSHWDDMSQSKRVGMTLGAAATAMLAVAAGGAAWAHRRR